LLKQDFQVEKVVLFGSMRALDRIHDRSDVDLAVWGLNPQAYFRAVGQLLALHPDISVDLIEVETAPPRLLQEIETTGVTLRIRMPPL
jgi:predicted nucleotidyltransferase